MGESLFIQPMKRWFKRKQTSRPIPPEDLDDPFEENDLASLRDIFELSETGTSVDPLHSVPGELNGGDPDRQLEEMNARLQSLELERSQLMARLNGGEPHESSEGAVTNKGRVQRAQVVSSQNEEVPSASPVSQGGTTSKAAAAPDLHELDFLAGTLKGAFSGAVEVDQQIRSLAQRRKGLRMQDLSDELYDFVRRIGALGGGR